jgi:hypothetical protein
LFVSLFGISLGLVACGSSDKDGTGGTGTPPSTATVQSYEGVYQLQTFTRNAAGCDAEGASRFDSEPDKKFLIAGGQVFGQNYLMLASCVDDAACASKLSAIRAMGGFISSYTVTLSQELGPNELGGLSAGTGFLVNGACTEREYTSHSLTRAGDALRIETRVTPLKDIPPEDNVCWAEPAKERAEAAGMPCAELSVFTGVKTGPLP